FSVFARISGRRNLGRPRRGGNAAAEVIAAVRGAAPSAIGVVLLLLTAVSWLVPFGAALLDFSDAEVQFLFPAPVSRRALLLHRMLRSQIGLLFGALIMGVAIPSVSGYGRVQAGIGTWLLLSIGKVYFTGVSLARTGLAKS